MDKTLRFRLQVRLKHLSHELIVTENLDMLKAHLQDMIDLINREQAGDAERSKPAANGEKEND